MDKCCLCNALIYSTITPPDRPRTNNKNTKNQVYLQY